MGTAVPTFATPDLPLRFASGKGKNGGHKDNIYKAATANGMPFQDCSGCPHFEGQSTGNVGIVLRATPLWSES
jgi:hypothetical protein